MENTSKKSYKDYYVNPSDLISAETRAELFTKFSKRKGVGGLLIINTKDYQRFVPINNSTGKEILPKSISFYNAREENSAKWCYLADLSK